MDSEGDPFETSEEEAYSRAIGELAKTELECSSRIGILQREVSRLASVLSSGTDGEGDGGTDLVNKTGRVEDPGSQTPLNISLAGNKTLSSKNETSLTKVLSGFFNGTSTENGQTSECPVCPDCPSPRECTPSQESPPCNPSSGGPIPGVDAGGHSDVVEIPMAFLMGAAATLLMMILAVVIGAIIRYLPLIVTGFLFLVSVCMVWYLSSKHPEAARRLGARVWEALRSGVTAVVDRLLGRRHPEVSVKYCMCREICEEVLFKESKDKGRVGV
jgi:hypothetical protein